jgi:macrolide transport system ATP-binding/permease protein
MLIAHGIEKSFAAETVLDGVSFGLHRGEKVGLVGRNGCGKTTLIRILAGVSRPDRGTVQVPPGVSVGHLPQTPDWPPNTSSLGAVLASGCQDWQARRALAGLAVAPDQDADTLSGGEKTRVLLARALLGEHQVLLLDEPTNHLDIRMLEFVEEMVRSRKGAVLCVSHDRRFLDNTVDRTIELDGGKVRSYRGGYSAYWDAKQAELRRCEALYIDQQKQIKLLTEFVHRQFERARSVASGPKAGRDYYGGVAKRMAKRARAAERRLEHVEKVDKPRQAEQVRIGLSARHRPANVVLEARGIGQRFGERWLFRDLSLCVCEGERIGVIGPNGAGKTTLIRLLLGLAGPTEGETPVGPSAVVAYSAQEQENLDDERTVLEELRTVGGIDETSARALLACFLFRQDDVFKRVAVLSMGERARLALAKASVSGANVLVLDEPTNYLDIPACERLETALASFAGTLIIVSHDRYLLDRLCTKWLRVEDGEVRVEHR